MKINIYFLIRSFFILLLFLLPLISLAQGLAPIPDVGEGVCVANCGSDSGPSIPQETPTPETTTICSNDCSGNGSCILEACFCFDGWKGDDCSIPKTTSTPVQGTQSHLDSVKELDTQALEELDEGKYVEAKGTINETIDTLNDTKEGLRTDPVVLEFCENKPKELNKIERAIQSSINSHNKAVSTVDRIIDITGTANRINNGNLNAKDELLQKLLKFAKKLLTRRIRVSNSFAVCGVRG